MVSLALDQPKPKGKAGTWEGERTRNQVLNRMLKELGIYWRQKQRMDDSIFFKCLKHYCLEEEKALFCLAPEVRADRERLQGSRLLINIKRTF